MLSVKRFVMENVITSCFRSLKFMDNVKKSNIDKSTDIFIENMLFFKKNKILCLFLGKSLEKVGAS